MQLELPKGLKFPNLQKSLPFKILFAASLTAIVSSFVALIAAFPSLPPEVPLLFTAGETLTAKWLLFLIPAFALFFFLTDAYFTDQLLDQNEPAAAIFPAFLNIMVNFLLAFSLFRIVRLYPTAPLPFEEIFYPLLFPFLTATTLSLLLTTAIKRASKKLKLTDKPHGAFPTVRPVPRLGAIPLYLTFAACSLTLLPLDKHLVALLIGGGIITLVQSVDDIRPLPFWVQGIGHLLAILAIIIGGVGVDYIRNPLHPLIGDRLIFLDRWQIPIAWRGVVYHFTVLADLLAVVWIFALVNIVDWLDGLDGLAAGVGTIAGVAVIAISIIAATPATALLGAILVGALIGFLPSNFYPARIYLGGGAFLLGYLLAALSIFSGAKTGTALLVLALPIIDALYVIYRRVREKRSPFHGDTTHLHHRLLEKGLSQPQIVSLEWGIVALLAIAALLLSGIYKLIGFLAVFTGALLLNRWLLRRPAAKGPKEG
jgi:UDP-GlcNAc:undecaprenyl-phosphate GlcNAc-1-phosphate transferase